MNRLDELCERLQSALGERLQSLVVALDEVTIVISGQDHLSVARTLRDERALSFEQLIDLCGVDYSSYGEGAWDGAALRSRDASAFAARTTGACECAPFALTMICR